VGLPLSLSGGHTKSTQMAANFARQLAVQTPASVFVIDERLSTVSSQRLLREAGRSAKQSKSMTCSFSRVRLVWERTGWSRVASSLKLTRSCATSKAFWPVKGQDLRISLNAR
ncbi:MAG: pre-16S rRNA-processing nuclease YqgF, partial [Gammaproteobacteria bacterium]|nr:pre-16S rRNA-processing nuclease YqgF [Gammaproteobacteria bacterium]